MLKKKDQDNIKVMLRVRGLSSISVQQDRNQKNVIRCGGKSYVFDQVFGSQCDNNEVFNKVGLQMIENGLEGYNSCLFVYGQTGTGKTYTMTGNSHTQGLLQQSLKLLWHRLQKTNQIVNFEMKMTYLQIYNETIRDLLRQKENSKQMDYVQMRQHTKLGFYVQGLEEQIIMKQLDIDEIIKKGNKNRNVKKTFMNQVSSRSHTILTVYIDFTVQIQSNTVIRSSKLNFVDLAGSQKQRQTEATGDRLKQASNINKSLTTLSSVISKLGEKKTRQTLHIPYRDSVLTKLLKDSLGGNSRTIIIGTISTNSEWVSETISTLLFLQKAKKIKNQIEVNQKIDGNQEMLRKKLLQYQQKMHLFEANLQELQKKLEQAKQSEQQKKQQIKQLQDCLSEYDKPITFFELNNKQNDSSFLQEQPFHNPFDDSVNQDSALTVIEEQKQNSLVEYNNRQNNQNDSKKWSKSDMLSNIKINKISDNFQSKNIKNIIRLNNIEEEQRLKAQIQKLKAQLDKYTKDDQKYDHILLKIADNIDNLNFDQSKLIILSAQQEKISIIEDRIKQAEADKQNMQKQLNQMRLKYKAELKCLRSIQIQKISMCSSYKSNQTQIKQQLQMIKQQNEQIKEDMIRKQDQFKNQILLLNKKISQLEEEKEEVQDKLRQNQQEMKKMINMVQFMEEEKKRSLSQQQTNHIKQVQQKCKLNLQMMKDNWNAQINTLKYQIQSIKAKSLSLQLQLKDKCQLIEQLKANLTNQKILKMSKDADINQFQASLQNQQQMNYKMKENYQSKLNSMQQINSQQKNKYEQLLNQYLQIASLNQILNQQFNTQKYQRKNCQKKIEEEKMCHKALIQSYKQSLQFMRGEVISKMQQIEKLKCNTCQVNLQQIYSLFQKNQQSQKQKIFFYKTQEKLIQIILNEKETFQKQNNKLRQQISSLKESYHNLKRKIQDKIIICQQKYDKKKAQIIILQKQNKKLNKICQKLKKQNQELISNDKSVKFISIEQNSSILVESNQENVRRFKIQLQDMRQQIKILNVEKKMLHIKCEQQGRAKIMMESEKKQKQIKLLLLELELNRVREKYEHEITLAKDDLMKAKMRLDQKKFIS